MPTTSEDYVNLYEVRCLALKVKIAKLGTNQLFFFNPTGRRLLLKYFSQKRNSEKLKLKRKGNKWHYTRPETGMMA